jgi:prophage antirepressor-like protein
MKNINEFKQIVNDYGLDEKETQIDENNMPWFTAKFLKELFGVVPTTIGNNINKLSNLGEIDLKSNSKKMELVRSDKPVVFHDINVLYSLGMWLRSPKALKFRKNIIKLLEGIRKGELQVIDTKSIYNNIALQPTSIYREKLNTKKLNEGVPEFQIEVRTFNVKLNNAVKIL